MDPDLVYTAHTGTLDRDGFAALLDLCHSFCDELDASILRTVREAPAPLRLDEVARAVQARDARLAWSMQIHVTPLGHLQEAERAGRLRAVVGDDGIMRWTQ